MTPARVDLKALEALVQKDEHPVHQCALIGTSVRPLIAALRIAVEALRTWPCFFCNGLGMRGPYVHETPDGEEQVPRHKCATCGGTGIDPQPEGRGNKALAQIAALVTVEGDAK